MLAHSTVPRQVKNVLVDIQAPNLGTLFSRQPTETFEIGNAVFWEDDVARDVFVILEGVLRLSKLLSDGRRAITGFVYTGDLLGVSLKTRFLYTAEAVTPVKLRRVGRTCFQDEINRSPELRPLLFARLCDEMAAAQDQMVLLGRKTAEERVCSFLLGCARRLSKNGEMPPSVDVPMTRLDMADYLGLTIETVSRAMTKLTNDGVIAAKARHAITIRKPKKLALLAGEAESNDEIDFDRSISTVRPAVWPHHA